MKTSYELLATKAAIESKVADKFDDLKSHKAAFDAHAAAARVAPGEKVSNHILEMDRHSLAVFHLTPPG